MRCQEGKATLALMSVLALLMLCSSLVAGQQAVEGYPLLHELFQPEGAPLEEAAARLSAEQRAAVQLKLRQLEAAATDAFTLSQVAKGYELLGGWEEFLRLQVAPPPVPESAFADASAALASGDNDRAALRAADILARDPSNPRARGILELAKRRVPEAELKPEAAATPSPSGPEDREILGLMLSASSAKGDHDKLLRLAQEAMRVAPTSPLAQQFYLQVADQRAERLGRQREAARYARESRRALESGNKEAAIAWARKAAEQDPGPAAATFVRQIQDARIERKAPQPIYGAAPEEPAGSFPFWPLAGAAAGFAALGAAAVRYGDQALLWARDHPYLAVGGGVVALGAVGWLTFGGAVGAGLTTTAGEVIPAAASVAEAGIKAAVVVKGAQATTELISRAQAEGSASNDPYAEAKRGGEHSGTFRNYRGRTTKEVQKARQSYLKQVELHREKLRSPERFDRNWSKLSEERRMQLINDWRGDVKRNQELADLMEGLLKERGL